MNFNRTNLLTWLVFLLTTYVPIAESDHIVFASSNNKNDDLTVTKASQQQALLNESMSDEDIKIHLDYYNILVSVLRSVQLWREIYISLGTCISFVGFTLNTLCILIFYKSKLFRNSSFPYYVYVISIVDTLNIFFRFLVPQSMEMYVRYQLVHNYNVTSFDQNKYDNYTSKIASDYHCSIFVYFYNSLTLISVWLMAAVSLERWLVIKFALQTKYMIKLRAILILFFIFIVIFSFNLFDLSPGFYTTQWYSNLTLLCEKYDNVLTENNSTHIYKYLGPLKFNTNTFALVRTIFQSVLPFLIVLIFNSLIIYNFKKIKLAALGGTRGKSNSFGSVFSGESNMFNSSSHFNHNNRNSRSLKTRRLQKLKQMKQNENQLDNTSLRLLDKENKPQNASSIIFSLANNNMNSSRSPSPCCPSPVHHNHSTGGDSGSTSNHHNHNDKSVTPTSLVSALNLTTSVPSNKTNNNGACSNNDGGQSNGVTQASNGINSNHNNKQFASSTYLMPPSHHLYSSSFQQQQNQRRSPSELNDSTTPSIGTTNSSANLSLLTTSNLTTTTLINNIQKQQQQQNMSNSIASEKFSLLITSLKPNKKSVSTMTTITTSLLNNRVSFKKRSSSASSKLKLNRETDIMLVVLSFIILISQLPFTVLWHLIYYHGILNSIDSLFQRASIPKIFYIIRLAEMVYYSLNFAFYICLSPSLRKELKAAYQAKKASMIAFINKKMYNNETPPKSPDSVKNSPSPAIQLKHAYKNNRNINVSTNNKNTNNIHKLDGNNNSNNHLGLNDHHHNTTSSLTSNKRLFSNSSGDYIDYLDKLRSISPIRRPNTFQKNFQYETHPRHQNGDANLMDSPDQNEVDQINKNAKCTTRCFFKKLIKINSKYKNRKSSDTSTKSELASCLNNNNLNTANIKIIIDDLNDENDFDFENENENEKQVNGICFNETTTLKQNDSSSSVSNNETPTILNNQNEKQVSFSLSSTSSPNNNLTSEKKMFNLSSPAFLIYTSNQQPSSPDHIAHRNHTSHESNSLITNL